MHTQLRLAAAAVVSLSACTGSTSLTSATAAATDPTSTTASETGDETRGGSETGGESDTETGSTGGEPPFDCACAAPAVIDGDLTITADTALSDPCIVEVTGHLKITGVTEPAALEPLRYLRRAQSVSIRDNPGLTDLGVLACLEETISLTIAHNPALVDGGALTRLSSLYTLSLWDLPLAALPPFAPELAGISSISLSELPEVSDIDALATWQRKPSEYTSVWISELPKLTSVAALAGPLGPPDPAVKLRIWLRELPALASLEGIEAQRAGDLSLVGLPQITTLAPLAGVTTLNTLELRRMPGLTSLGGLGALETAGWLQLGGCAEGDGLSGLSDLSGLDALTSVYTLEVFGNPQLAGLTGAPALTHVTRADLVDNPQLAAETVAAFEAMVAPATLCVGDQADCGCLTEAPGALGWTGEGQEQGCATTFRGGSAVTAEGVGGPLSGVTALFGWLSENDPQDPVLALYVFDSAADVDAAIAGGVLEIPEAAKPQLRFVGSRPYHSWIGADTGTALLLQPDEDSEGAQVTVTISERLGDWLTFDPDDPPRLVGAIATPDPDAPTTVEGPFEAAYCGAFTTVIPI
ncbi:MAG: hypothetical protein R3A79_03265 [Nannocystaceae bacterium]